VAPFALVLVLLLPAGLAAQVASPLAGLLWTEIFVFLVPAVVATAGANLEPRAWLRLRAPSPSAAGLALLVGGSAWFLGSALFAAVRAVAPEALVQRYDLTRLFEGPVVEQVAFAVTAALVAPVCEEVAFRGYLVSAWLSRSRPALAVGGSAILFALLHLDPIRAPSLLLLGALYGWLSWRSGSIWPAVIAHATNNGIGAALLLLSPDDAGGAEPTLGMALVGVAAGTVAIAVIAAIFRAASPPTPLPAGVSLRDASDPSSRFQLRRLPRPLVVALAAGWLSLGAILLGAR
jgi:membrane protease YdiL (CAAX protease family)